MNSRLLIMMAATLLVAATAAAQNPDATGDGLVKGNYFVREVLMTGSASGAVTTAISVTGTATFDGKGNFTFTGASQSLASGANNSVSLTGTYNVAANGIFEMTSLADLVNGGTGGANGGPDTDFGGVSAIGPWAFVASATENFNVTLLIGIPVGSNDTNATFKGNYTAGAIDFPGANINSVREAGFSLTADGAGNLGSVTLNGAAADQGGGALTQTATGVTYTLTANGSGTVNFGGASTQIVNGSKNLYVSADGKIVMGGSATGYDMFVAIPALTGAASNATASGEFYMGGFENSLGTSTTPTAIDAYYGSVNETGSGTSLFHNRVTSLVYSVSDYTFDSMYTVASNGTVPVGDIMYSYTYGDSGANGAAQAFIALGDAVDDGFYSLTVGFAQQSFSGSGVYLAPNGVVSSATFSPITNPIAPNEFITLVGTGLASAPASASSLPLPTSLGGVTVTINDTQVPLNYVSPTQIVALVPSAISPDNGVYYATVRVTSNNVASNSVTVYTSDTAPGVLANPVAVGAAAAEHANYSLIDSSSPATIGETVIIYTLGLGAVTPTVPDGSAAPSSPLSTVNDEYLAVDFAGSTGDTDAEYPLPFAGLTPTAAGLYQIDVPIPSGTSPGTVYVDVATTDGYTSQATMSIAGGTVSSAEKAKVRAKRLAARTRNRAKKTRSRTLAR